MSSPQHDKLLQPQKGIEDKRTVGERASQQEAHDRLQHDALQGWVGKTFKLNADGSRTEVPSIPPDAIDKPGSDGSMPKGLVAPADTTHKPNSGTKIPDAQKKTYPDAHTSYDAKGKPTGIDLKSDKHHK